MRTLLLCTLAIVLGVALGVGTATLRIRSAPWSMKIDEGVKKAPAVTAAPPSGPTAKAVVDKADYDFGSRDIETSSGSHEFVFANKGDGPLELKNGGTSCRCTMSELAEEKIPPGGSTKVTITWKPVEKPGPYQQTAKILTNDPARPEIALTISGRVTAAMRFSPTELVFSQLSVGDSATAQSRLYCYLDTPLKILGHKWSNAATASYYEMTQTPLSPTELKEEPTARSGANVKVNVKGGMPQGPIHQKLLLQTNLPSSPTLAIEGSIGSEIAIAGRGWDPDTGILNIGEVVSRAGVERKLLLIVRGQGRKGVKFTPQRIEPDMLHVSVGEPHEINKGAVVQVPLQVAIPPGSPPVNRLGTDQGRLGEIILETTYPQVPKLRILVRFAIEG
jgi:hypothetical protein